MHRIEQIEAGQYLPHNHVQQMRDSILLIIAPGRNASAQELSLYPDVFSRLIKLENLPFDIRVRNIISHPDVELLETDKAVAIGGSPYCLDENLPWMNALKKFIKWVYGARIKLAGICFGQQIITEALGGKVSKCPGGGELGRVQIDLTDAGRKDFLFEGIESPFSSISAHRDVVIRPPDGSEVLAKNDANEYQALSIGPNIRTVQFHPEMSADYFTGMLQRRKESFMQDGLIRDGAHLTRIRELAQRGDNEMTDRILKNILKWMTG